MPSKRAQQEKDRHGRGLHDEFHSTQCPICKLLPKCTECDVYELEPCPRCNETMDVCRIDSIGRECFICHESICIRCAPRYDYWLESLERNEVLLLRSKVDEEWDAYDLTDETPVDEEWDAYDQRKRLLAGVPEQRVPQVVSEGGRLRQGNPLCKECVSSLLQDKRALNPEACHRCGGIILPNENFGFPNEDLSRFEATSWPHVHAEEGQCWEGPRETNQNVTEAIIRGTFAEVASDPDYDGPIESTEIPDEAWRAHIIKERARAPALAVSFWKWGLTWAILFGLLAGFFLLDHDNMSRMIGSNFAPAFEENRVFIEGEICQEVGLGRLRCAEGEVVSEFQSSDRRWDWVLNSWLAMSLAPAALIAAVAFGGRVIVDRVAGSIIAWARFDGQRIRLVSWGLWAFVIIIPVGAWVVVGAYGLGVSTP